MYLDALDPVRTSEKRMDVTTCKNFSIQGESTLFKTLLEVDYPILTQTQVMDSKVIHDIMLDESMKDSFLSFVEKGYIHIARYKNLKDKGIRGLQ